MAKKRFVPAKERGLWFDLSQSSLSCQMDALSFGIQSFGVVGSRNSGYNFKDIMTTHSSNSTLLFCHSDSRLYSAHANFSFCFSCVFVRNRYDSIKFCCLHCAVSTRLIQTNEKEAAKHEHDSGFPFASRWAQNLTESYAETNEHQFKIENVPDLFNKREKKWVNKQCAAQPRRVRNPFTYRTRARQRVYNFCKARFFLFLSPIARNDQHNRTQPTRIVHREQSTGHIECCTAGAEYKNSRGTETKANEKVVSYADTNQTQKTHIQSSHRNSIRFGCFHRSHVEYFPGYYSCI